MNFPAAVLVNDLPALYRLCHPKESFVEVSSISWNAPTPAPAAVCPKGEVRAFQPFLTADTDFLPKSQIPLPILNILEPTFAIMTPFKIFPIMDPSPPIKVSNRPAIPPSNPALEPRRSSNPPPFSSCSVGLPAIPPVPPFGSFKVAISFSTVRYMPCCFAGALRISSSIDFCGSFEFFTRELNLW